MSGDKLPIVERLEITDAMIDRELALDPGIPMTCMCCRDEARRKIVERREEDRRLGDRRAA